VALCFWAESSHCCEGSQCLYPQGQAVCFVCFDCFTLKVMAPHAPQNFGKYRSSDTVSHPRRQLYHCENFKLSVLENILFQFTFLLKHRFYLNLAAFYLKNELFRDRKGQHVRLSDTYKDVFTY